ncbi:MAG: hypothetical protein C0475_01355 [Planctomyces sp.]|nr:hypothetical protein [Planctomyces sp.]
MLVLAIGVLALLAILVVAYVSVGQADRQSGAQAQSDAELRRVVDQMGRYLAGVIGDSATNVARFRDPTNSARDLVYRVAADVPGVDPVMLSTPVTGNPADGAVLWRRFDPTGNMSQMARGRQDDPRRVTTPWLSRSAPGWLNRANTPRNPAGFPFRENRDWVTLSNFAPSGNFVNLALLRGRFDAPSGFAFASGSVSGPGAADPPGLSGVLFNPGAGDQPADLAGRVQSIAGVTAGGAELAADVRRPFDWTMWQVNAFRPVGDTDYLPGDPRNLDNMFRDTDGDGFIDARLFEMVDAWDPVRPRSLLIAEAGLRYFFAVKAEDLSAAINVNTAVDFSRPSNVLYPPGASPADVDLRRFLASFGGASELFSNVPARLGDQATRVQIGYDGYAPAVAELIGRAGFLGLIQSRLGAPLAPGDDFSVNQLRTRVPRLEPGSVDTARPLLDGARNGFGFDFINAIERRDLYVIAGRDPFGVSLVGDELTSDLRYGNSFGLAELLELRAFGGLNSPGTPSRLESAVDGRLQGPGGSPVGRLGPLRSNVPLESDRELDPALAGATNPIDRWQPQLMLAGANVRRSLTTVSGARPIIMEALGVELDGQPRDWSSLSGGSQPLDINAAIDAIVRDIPEDNFLPIMMPDSERPRRDDGSITPGARRAAEDIFGAYVSALAPMLGVTDTNGNRLAQWWDTVQVRPALARLFYGADRQDLSLPPGQGPQWTGRPAESALITAAHLTANLIARSVPRGGTDLIVGPPPSGLRVRDETVALTVMLTSDLNSPVRTETDPGNAAARSLPYDPVALGLNSFPGPTAAPSLSDSLTRSMFPSFAAVLDLDREIPLANRELGARLAPVGTQLISDAVTVYGVTPQPVLVQVATFAQYVDAHAGLGGDSEFFGTGGGPVTPEEPSIVGGPNSGGNTPPTIPNPAGPITPGNPGAIPGPGSGPGPGAGPDGNSGPDVIPDIIGGGNVNPITINGNMSPSNADFLFEVAVVKLHNPFSVPLPLSGSQPDSFPYNDGEVITNQEHFAYFVEFSGRYYALREIDDNGNRRAIVLAPGQTRAFWLGAMSGPDIVDRWQPMASQFGLSLDRATAFQQWINAQAGVGGLEVNRLEPFDPVSGQRVGDTTLQTEGLGVLLPYSGPGTVSGAASQGDLLNRQVQLWKRVNTPIAGATPATGRTPIDPSRGTRLTPGADVLVDRIREPSPQFLPVLDNRLDPINQRVLGTFAGPDPTEGLLSQFNPLDNTGFVITTYGVITRPGQDAGTLGERGVLPAFMIEVKSPTGSRTPTAGAAGSQPRPSLNRATKPFNGRSLTVNEFTGSSGLPPSAVGREFGVTLASQLNGVTIDLSLRIGAGQPGFSAPITAGPQFAYENNATVRNLITAGFRQARSVPASNGAVGSTIEHYPLVAADVLSNLAIGPSRLHRTASQVAARGEQIGSVDWYDSEFTTLGEAMAMALGFGAATRSDDPMFGIAGDPSTGTANRRVFPNGTLSRTDYVPTVDVNGDGLFERSVLASPADAALAVADRSIGPGIPMGLDVLNRFRFDEFAAGGSVIPGLVNMNTATGAVLRMVPLLAPDRGQWLGARADGADIMSPPQGESFVRLIDRADTNQNNAWDVVGTLEAYRDTGVGLARPLVANQPFLDPIGQPVRVDMRGPQSGRSVVAGGIDPTNRAEIAGAPRARVDPGLLTPAELLLARVGELTQPQLPIVLGADPASVPELTGSDPRAFLRGVSVDRLGRTQAQVSQGAFDGLANGIVPDYHTPAPLIEAGQTPVTPNYLSGSEDVAENASAIASAALGTVSVRSDYFVVYFTLEGYRPEDVQTLRWQLNAPLPTPSAAQSLADPLVPTVSRRYMMVVDRSNVIRRDQAPRILMLQEVPQ